MPQNITKGYRALIEEAERQVESVDVARALDLHKDGRALFVDLRDVRELHPEGKIPGAMHCPRGMLEFWVDPDSPYHRAEFSGDGPFLFFCAAGWRSALATKTAADMGLEPVAHIAGGFSEWKEAGGPVELPGGEQDTKTEGRAGPPD